MTVTSADVARALLTIKAVRFSVAQPVTFKSGLVSPVYVDNRQLIYHPQAWRVVITGLRQLIAEKNLEFEIIGGIATAGIPHSSVLAYELQKPSVYIRKEAKDHGLKNYVEGGAVAGKRVLLLEDMISSGSSSLQGLRRLREAEAVVTDCLCIGSYGFPMAIKAYAAEKIALHPLISFADILEEAVATQYLTAKEKVAVEDWLSEPQGWAGRQ